MVLTEVKCIAIRGFSQILFLANLIRIYCSNYTETAQMTTTGRSNETLSLLARQFLVVASHKQKWIGGTFPNLYRAAIYHAEQTSILQTTEYQEYLTVRYKFNWVEIDWC